MADGTHIEWTDATWNVVTGCSVVSPGCTNCYAMKLAGTRLRHHPSRAGLTIDTKAGPVWNGQVSFNEEWLDQPLRWTKPRKIFVAAHGDLFHEGVLLHELDQIFAVMALCPQHVFQILTKRPDEMRRYVTGFDDAEHGAAWRTRGRVQKAMYQFDRDASLHAWPLPNVWLGVSVEDQARADERIPILLDTPAALRGISAEPLLGPVNLGAIQAPRYVPEDHDIDWKFSCLETGDYYFYCGGDFTEGGDGPYRDTRIDWVVAGGESGAGSRPMHHTWARLIRDQCAEAGVPFLFKQWGDWLPICEMPGDSSDLYHPTPVRYPEAARRCKVDNLIMHSSGETFGPGRRDILGAFASGMDAMHMFRVGKKAAGRRLNGILHDGYPEAAQ